MTREADEAKRLNQATPSQKPEQQQQELLTV
jgi:hypothetical protein